MSIAVLHKTFEVLEALSAASKPVPLQELAKPLGLPKPTVYRILHTLRDLGYIGQEDRTGFYFPTSRLANLGHPNPYAAVERRGRPLLEALFKQFNETINLGVLEGPFVRYVVVLETTQALRHVAAPRSKDLFYSTAIGRAFAAFLPQAEQERLIDRVDLKPYTPHTITDPVELRRELAQTARRGYSQELGENDPDLVCFGAPLIEDGRPVGAISVSLPRFRCTPPLRKEITQALAAITARTFESAPAAATTALQGAAR